MFLRSHLEACLNSSLQLVEVMHDGPSLIVLSGFWLDTVCNRNDRGYMIHLTMTMPMLEAAIQRANKECCAQL